MSNKFKNKMIMNKKSKNKKNNNMYRSTNTKLPFADSNKLAINIGTLIVYYQSSSCEQKKAHHLTLKKIAFMDTLSQRDATPLNQIAKRKTQKTLISDAK